MRKKHSYVIFFVLLFLPLMTIFPNTLITETTTLPAEDSIEVIPLAVGDFTVKVHIGDPLKSPYKSYEFNPGDDVLITGSVRNDKDPGTPVVTVQLWLVKAKSPYAIQTSIANLSGTISQKTSKTLKVLNGNSDVIWNIGNFKAGTYRIMAQASSAGGSSQPVVSGKSIVIRQIRLLDFEITTAKAAVVQTFSLAGLSSYGLTYHAGYLYMTDRTNNDILKINPSDASIVETISISGYSGNPYGITTDHKSGWYIAYRGNSEYIRANWDGSFNFKENPPSTYPMAVTMLGSYLGITHDSSSEIFKIAPFTGAIQDSWSVAGGFIYALAVDSTNNWIWYSDLQNDLIHAIDYNTHVEQFVFSMADITGLTYDGTYLWAWDNTAKQLKKINPFGYTFYYDLTNVGNCDILGYINVEIQKHTITQTRGVEPSPFHWVFYDGIDSGLVDGSVFTINQGQSKIGSVKWLPDTQAPSGVYRLYMGLRDANGEMMYNLNNSVPVEHPTQGGMYLDSDKVPRLQVTRDITTPSSVYVKEDLNVTLHCKVIGVLPEHIGIFNISSPLIYGIRNINLVEEINEAVLSDPKDAWYSIDGGPKYLMPGGASKDNSYYFNSSYFGNPKFSSMNVGEELILKYNIEANFTPEIKRPYLPGETQESKKNIGFREDLVVTKQHSFATIQATSLQAQITVAGWLDPANFISQIGVVVYMGRLFELYDAIESLALIIKLAIWVSNLPSFYDGVIYFIDEDLSTTDSLNFMGLTAAQKNTYNSLDTIERAEWLFDHVDDQLIAQAIDNAIDAEAQANDWDIIMLIGGVNVIPMFIVDNPSFPLWNDIQEVDPTVATDWFYGDWDPGADVGNLDVVGWTQEVTVARLPGDDPVDIINLVDNADLDTPTSGECGIVSYFKGEDSMRRLERTWGAVKAGGTYYETEGQWTWNNIWRVFNPGHADYGGAANYPYAMVIYNDHAWVNHFQLDHDDLALMTDYVDGARPFVILRSCASGYIGDDGDICDIDENGVVNHYTEANSITLDLLDKGVTGVLASTRISFSPYGAEWCIVDSTNVQPAGCPASVSGTYWTGQMNVDGVLRDCVCVDPGAWSVYNTHGIDFDGDGQFDANEIYNQEAFFEDPLNPAGTWDWRYQMGDLFFMEDAGGPGVDDMVLWYANNDAEDWNDVFLSFFMGESGTGIMQGRNVGAAFFNAKQRYWAYMQTGVHVGDAEAEAFDRTLLLEFHLYGVPIYNPDMQDPPINATYIFETTPIDSFGFNASIGINNYTVSEVRKGSYLFEIQGAGLTGGQWQPKLPMIMENVTIPAGFHISNIQVVSNISTQLPGTYNIPLSQPHDPVIGPGDDFYFNYTVPKPSLSGEYPGKLWDYTTIENKDGTTTVYLSIFPFQWNADTKTVMYHQNLTLNIELTDTLEDSVSLAVAKSSTTKTVGRGSNVHFSLVIANNGSNPVYNIRLVETIDGEFKDSEIISMLSTSGVNSSALKGMLVSFPSKWFSGWVTTKTTITYQDGAGTEFTMIVTKSIYLETWIGIIVLILILIMALAVTIAILKAR